MEPTFELTTEPTLESIPTPTPIPASTSVSNNISMDETLITSEIPEKPSVFTYAYDYTFETLSKDQISEIVNEGKKLTDKTGVQAIAIVVKTFGNYSV